MTPRDPYKRLEDESDGPLPSANLLPPVLGLIGIGIGVIIYAVLALTQPPGQWDDALSHCAVITDAHARLACYDQGAGPHPPAKGAFAPVGTYPHERTP
jgi:hypothetical protein